MKISRLAVLAFASATMAWPAHLRAADAAKRPNILWLIAEDMGPEALSRSGTPEVQIGRAHV